MEAATASAHASSTIAAAPAPAERPEALNPAPVQATEEEKKSLPQEAVAPATDKEAEKAEALPKPAAAPSEAKVAEGGEAKADKVRDAVETAPPAEAMVPSAAPAPGPPSAVAPVAATGNVAEEKEEEEKEEEEEERKKNKGTAPATAGGAESGKLRPCMMRLDEAVLAELAAKHAERYDFDVVPREYAAQLLELLDLRAFDFRRAARAISSELFWKKACASRWPVLKPAEHGQSYKRMYAELHLAEALERYHPSREALNWAWLQAETAAASPFVRALRIRQLPSHADVWELLGELPQLSVLSIVFGSRNTGMDYERSHYGMAAEDAESLARLVRQSRSLISLTLSENLINDALIETLADAVEGSSTLTELCLAHNAIGDDGAKRLAQMFDQNHLLARLDLTDNRIGAAGAAALGSALASPENVLEELLLSLNPLGDDGGAALFDCLRSGNRGLRRLCVSACGLRGAAYRALIALLEASGALRALDISANLMFGDGGRALLQALHQQDAAASAPPAPGQSVDLTQQREPGLEELRCRRNNEDAAAEAQMQALVSKHAIAAKRQRRKKIQYNGWDE